MRILEREPGWLRRRVSTRHLWQLGVLGLLVAAFVGGIAVERSGLTQDAEVALANKPEELRAQIFSPVDRLTLDLSHVNYQRLAFER